MTLQIVVDGNVQPLDQLTGYLDKLDENARRVYYKVAVEVFNELRAQMLAALQFYPPVPAGSTYKRTFRLRRGWQVDLELSGDSVTLVVFNPTSYTRYVVGLLTNVDAAARATQRAFHARNGWPIALDTSRFWFDQFKDAFIEAFIDAIIKDIQAHR